MGRFLTPAWLLRHAIGVVLTLAFLGLGWWQWNRAQEGNMLSWGYTFQWPLFAAFVVALWIREVRAELKRAAGSTSVDAPTEEPLSSPFSVPAPDKATGDDATDAYNRYLSWLAANPNRRPGEYPG
ncbi:hypothetical protein [Stackebrandtia nassauensis]|uniref:DNA-binding transcriptional regulator of glucitol operon n=1 Tax=Stackebrandtia nassauensis (strain DSM 44728 / CIP 108903 / NRRL B-16338 / NBRC 102104 / LLR-40K-21) TaxID=446470 RepID=D3PZY9_STANL|nr:hypothetical protein [Stackebrandtia nassauensis]ADD43676.1 hypothetical protein Snas_4024 [Stackebrandtia nassauensis DSM 44728]